MEKKVVAKEDEARGVVEENGVKHKKEKKEKKENAGVEGEKEKKKKKTTKKKEKEEEGDATEGEKKKKKKKTKKTTDADGEVKKKKKKKKETSELNKPSEVIRSETAKVVQNATPSTSASVPGNSAAPAHGEDSEVETPRAPTLTSQEKALRIVQEAKSCGRNALAFTSLQLHQDQLPEEISELEDTVVSIDLSFNLMTDIPLPVLLMSNLQRLKANGNVMERLSILRGAFVSLQELDLNGNNLTSLPAEIGYLTNLRLFDASNNQLESLPAELGALTKLEELRLSGNPFSELPKTIGNCGRLEILDLANCKLKSLPSQITYISKLTELDVSANKLETLPEEIGLLPRLTNIKAINNSLKDLPVSIACCPYLQRVALNGNEFVDDDLAVFAVRSSNALLNFLKDRITTSIGDPRQVRDYVKQLNEKREPLVQVMPSEDGEGGFVIKEKLSHEKEMQKQAEAAKKDSELRDKILNIKKMSVDQYSQLNEWVYEMKNKNWTLNNPQDIIALASYVGQLKPEMDAMRERIAPFLVENYKITQPQEGEDKVGLVKRSVDVSLDNVGVTVRALMKGIREEPDMGKVVLLAKDLLTLHSHFGKYLGRISESPTA